MVQAVSSLQEVAHAARAATEISTAAQLAQRALASAAKLTDATKTLAEWKMDALGSTLYLAADGSYISLTELTNGPLLPRVEKLLTIQSQSLPASTEVDALLQRALQVVKECERRKFFQEATPAELVQLIDLEWQMEFCGKTVVTLPATPCCRTSLKLTGPGEESLSLADLEQMPVYPSVRERLIWDQRRLKVSSEGHIFGQDTRYIQQGMALGEMCSHRSWMIGWTMSEAEILQYEMIAYGHWQGPSIEVQRPLTFTDSHGIARPLAVLNVQPPSNRVRMIEEVWTASPVQGEEWIYYLHQILMDREYERLLLELSDAELYQWRLILMIKYD